METVCLEKDCNRKVRSRGRCNSHYEKWRRNNRDLVTPKAGKWFNSDGTRMTCGAGSCDFPVDSMGLCKHHYQNSHYMKTKGANKPRRNRKITAYNGEKLEMVCTFEGCGRPEFNPGLCGGHYYQLKKTGELRPLHETASCPVSGCESTYFVAKNTQMMCVSHIALRGKYGMSVKQFLELHEKPGCHNPGCDYLGDDRHVDHDHACCNRRGSCGKCVRGLLCRGCNSALGTTKEDPERIKGLLEYLKLD